MIFTDAMKKEKMKMSNQKIIHLTIDGKQVEVPEGTTILSAARQANIDIPTLCFLKDINEIGDCRIEVKHV